MIHAARSGRLADGSRSADRPIAGEPAIPNGGGDDG
jgi:hypothetical protein